jgi:hypothetical protein
MEAIERSLYGEAPRAARAQRKPARTYIGKGGPGESLVGRDGVVATATEIEKDRAGDDRDLSAGIGSLIFGDSDLDVGEVERERGSLERDVRYRRPRRGCRADSRFRLHDEHGAQPEGRHQHSSCLRHVALCRELCGANPVRTTCSRSVLDAEI